MRTMRSKYPYVYKYDHDVALPHRKKMYRPVGPTDDPANRPTT